MTIPIKDESPSKFDPVDAPLLSSFTHQIINPLNGVVGTIDNLIDNTIVGARRQQRLKAVRAQLSLTIELVRNLAYLSHLSTETGREGLRQVGQRSSIGTTVIEAALFFQEVAADKNMKIQLDEGDDYTILGPKDLLRQVFTNLLENAVKYGETGTVIHIRRHVRSRDRTLIVEVENMGPGFSHGERELLFERGYRGVTAKQLTAAGSGLGLYICRQILEAAFDATIDAEHSVRHSRTTFRIKFPKWIRA